MNISSSKGHDSVIINRRVPTEVDRCLCFKANVLKYEELVKGLGKGRYAGAGGGELCVDVCVHTHTRTCVCKCAHQSVYVICRKSFKAP